MATHNVTVLDAANWKRMKRRELAESAGSLKGKYLDELRYIGDLLAPKQEPATKKQKGRDNFATFVVGCWPDAQHEDPKALFFAVAKLTEKEADASAKKKEVFQAAKEKLKFIKTLDQIVFITACVVNLHAEMAIVRYLHGKGVAKQDLKAGGLEIYCSGKPVCTDCSGWMTRHGIPHQPVDGSPSPTGWRNPITDAIYKGAAGDVEYTKASKYPATISDFNKNDQEYKGSKRKEVQADYDEL
ncbi:MAG TPA: hypothetical protein VG675_18155 [Bryobacteraceae bacterium]|nr:hypothetical protein [Bryobacteraceae bacterium]